MCAAVLSSPFSPLILIGRPLGMSCGCPITHCGMVMEADHRTEVVLWCVTGPLGPRQQCYKDPGYYVAEGYEGPSTTCSSHHGWPWVTQAASVTRADAPGWVSMASQAPMRRSQSARSGGKS